VAGPPGPPAKPAAAKAAGTARPVRSYPRPLEETAAAKPLLGRLDALLAGALQPRLATATARARDRRAGSGEPFGWAVLDLPPDELPPSIGSAWVFAIAGGTHPEPHRHPNSVQHLRSLSGEGRVVLSRIGADARQVFVLNAGRPWLVIGQDVVHDVASTSAAEWVVASFHTVPAAELVEVTAAGVRHYAGPLPDAYAARRD
jgi:hypothetical protein